MALWAEALWDASGGKVTAGPFAGMRYIQNSVGSAWAPKVLGIYEKELWPAVEAAAAERYDTLVDIGAAEGYYAVGFARRLPHIRVIAFEADLSAHRLLHLLSAANGVERQVEVHGLCTSESLSRALVDTGNALIICDAEGAENVLLDPGSLPALSMTDLIVEMHHWVHPGIEEILKTRFGPTHLIETIHAVQRTEADWPNGMKMLGKHRAAIMDEIRPPSMAWMWLRRRLRPDGVGAHRLRADVSRSLTT